MAGLPKTRRMTLVVVAGVAVVLAVGGGFWWANKQKYESTDNAFIAADKVSVASQVDGYVAQVLVEDNQRVAAGQVVARLDAASLQAKLAQAVANAAALDAAVRGVDDKSALETAMIAQKAAGVDSAHAQAQMATAELNRYGALAKQGWVSSQRAQSARAAASTAAAGVAQAQAALEAERRAAESLGSARDQTFAQAQAAHAAVDSARIDVSRTEIRAPVAGVVGARAVRPGQYVRPGANLMSIVPLGQAYVVANFKETQVSRLRIGQPVEIRADAFGKQVIRGRIDSFAPATGSEFALIPVENAVGNFTKIAQRLPVKIAVDPKEPLAGALRPGLSVEVKVNVRQATGLGFADATPPTELVRRGVSR
ncbi:MAG: HlyD family secretion protein [Pseudomonadota bacterium]